MNLAQLYVAKRSTKKEAIPVANAAPRILVMGATGQVGKGDVLDVMSKKGLHRLRKVTVFTTVTSALPDEVTLGGIHQAQSGWYYPYFRYCV